MGSRGRHRQHGEAAPTRPAATIYAATSGGLSISTNGGTTFTNYTTANSGLGGGVVKGVYAVGGTVYAATQGGGLSIGSP